jgi:nanoRNase/pAp phosphatase (c-di-AMP/oligoRNAs hydrolase)
MRSENGNNAIATKLAELDRVLSSHRRLLIVLHDNPDPDALASGAALSYLAKKRCNVTTTIAYGGMIGRAENRVMVRELRIPVKQLPRIRLASYGNIAVVDTQPGAGNNSLPQDRSADVVIDHHPLRRGVRASFVEVKPNYGATATILVEWLLASGLEIPANLATALSYAISSETQDLGRETSERDVRAYLAVYPHSSMRKLSRIIHAKLPRSYFATLAKALHQAVSFRNLICVHLGEVPTPEIVPEIADLMVRHERIGWSLCTGRFNGDLVISVRSTNPRAKAGKLLQRLVANRGRAGGHDMTAGGRIPLQRNQQDADQALEQKLTQEFGRLLGQKEANWRPLLESES